MARKIRQFARRWTGLVSCTALALAAAGPAAAEEYGLHFELTISAGSPTGQARITVSQDKSLSDQTDLNVAYQQAAQAMRQREHSTALYQLLIVLNQERPSNRKQVHDIMAALLDLLGDDPVVGYYRQQLAAVG